QQIHELQERTLAGGDTLSTSDLTLNEVAVESGDELVRLKQEVDQQRQQLEEDGKAMMAQMREMEMAMAKERAELARQRQEMQRLQEELAREVESSRNPQLCERLQTMRRSLDPKGATSARPGVPPVFNPEPAANSNGGLLR